MKKLSIIIITILLFAVAAFPCRNPNREPIHGQVLRNIGGIGWATQAQVRLETPGGDLLDTFNTGPFGYYTFSVVVCEDYVVRAVNKQHTFAPEFISMKEFTGTGVHRNILEVSLAQSSIFSLPSLRP